MMPFPLARASSVRIATNCSSVPCSSLLSCSGPGVCPACDVHTSGEDLPHAYRKIPMQPDHSWACVVAYFDPLRGCPRFRRCRGMLFGLPLAVSAFNRLPMLTQAVARRLFFIMVSLYFDDLTQQDWSELAARSQSIVGRVFDLCGYPFASDKRQTPAASGDFLGLLHDLSEVRASGIIKVGCGSVLSTRSMTLWILPKHQARFALAKHPSSLAASPFWIRAPSGAWPGQDSMPSRSDSTHLATSPYPTSQAFETCPSPAA